MDKKREKKPNFVTKLFSKNKCCLSKSEPDNQSVKQEHVVQTTRYKVKSQPQIRKQLICKSCKLAYVEPKLLSCQHSVCSYCLEKLKSEATLQEDGYYDVKCPICKSSNYFDNSTNIDFVPNYFLTMMIKKYLEGIEDPVKLGLWPGKRESFCQTCTHKKESAAKICITCDLHLCKKCFEELHAKKEYANHISTSPEENSDDLQKCFYHRKNNITLYCMTEKTPICRLCRIFHHETHPVVLLSEAFKTETASLFDTIVEFSRMKHAVENDMKKAEIFKPKLAEHGVHLKQQLSIVFNLLHTELYRMEREMKAHFHNKIKKKEEELDKFLRSSSEKLLHMEALIAYSKEALKVKSHVTFLQSFRGILKEIKEVASQTHRAPEKLTQDPLDDISVDVNLISNKISNATFNPIIIEFLDKKCCKTSPNFIRKTLNSPNTSESASSHSSRQLMPQSRLTTSAECLKCVDDFAEKTINLLYERPKSLPSLLDNSSDKLFSDFDSPLCFDNKKSSTASSSACFLLGTLDFGLPEKPNIYRHALDGNGVKVFWLIPEHSRSDSFIIQYQEVLPDGQLEVKHEYAGIKGNEFVISPLNPKAEYLFRVRSVNVFGMSQWSNAYQVSLDKSKLR
ncbi:tripartite motif-containing protein 42 [Latimeria chalumnae]|uniref:Tripartite motif containing 42 n=1 Tax=Latimeria chalumnae TaxID=7897 RepID=H3B191_LATCH|nr:PREDICTED: tripartite motif-containing protein 42 isoform X2 [Latimeria chalumnae]XP_014347087.1 PREDICTED: tripartite motif-containing protein 42 isoform X2 [Latimeria chalumnae]XP_014347088.1 PREDICTED: tripartite motif-containing protein 42 isoform X2 [Latimeria chalumnae]|eukprot:XP_014347085.1 PREDICTED: tripartite motif-containing protein 42 isoform X2 [Latimeria chalumnae]